VGVSVVRESTQGVASADADQEVSLPQLTQEGQFDLSFLCQHSYFEDKNLAF